MIDNALNKNEKITVFRWEDEKKDYLSKFQTL